MSIEQDHSDSEKDIKKDLFMICLMPRLIHGIVYFLDI